MRSNGAYSLIQVSIEGPAATVSLNRPEKLNALTIEMVGELADAVRMVAATESVRAIVITGAGKAFCAGADVTLLRTLIETGDEATGRRLVDSLRSVAHAIRDARQPVIAAVNGVAAGGGANLALACDLRIAAEDAQIGQVFMRIGLHPDFGGTYYLPRLVGASKALELFLGAELIGAEEAARLGIFNRLAPSARLAAEAGTWARRIADAPPIAVRHAKQAVYKSERATLDEMLDFELEAQIACFKSADGKEGLTAFFEKRPPHFTGR